MMKKPIKKQMVQQTLTGIKGKVGRPKTGHAKTAKERKALQRKNQTINPDVGAWTITACVEHLANNGDKSAEAWRQIGIKKGYIAS